MKPLRIGSYAATDVGLVRQGNEDSYYRGSTVFAVADGMGGHLAGEVASKAALGPIEDLDGVHFPDAASAEAALVEAIREANSTVVSQASANPDYRGMGTTLTAAMVRDGRLHVAHVGDSRAYLLRRGEPMTQLTTDHTLVEQLIQQGRLSRDEAAIHPQRSVITRAIGVDEDVQIDTFPPIALQPGDQVLLCSDGLSGPVSDDAIADILDNTPEGQDACEHLLNAANDSGGPDNITVVLLRVDPGPDRSTTAIGGGARAGSAADPAAGAMAAPGATAVGTGVDATQDLGRDPGQDLGRDLGRDPGSQASAPPEGDVRQIRTRDERGGDWASSMGRYADQQGAKPASVGGRRDGAGRGARRAAAIILAVVVLLALIAGGGWLILARAYFVGVADGQVAVYNGVPQEVASLRLYWLEETSDVAVEDLQPRFQNALEEGITVGSLAEARRTIDDYRQEVEERATPDPSPPPDPAVPAATADPAAAPGAAPGADPGARGAAPNPAPGP